MQKQVEVTVQLKFNVNESLTNGDIDSEVTAALQDVLASVNSDIITADTEDVTVTDIHHVVGVPVIDLDKTMLNPNKLTKRPGDTNQHPNGLDSWYETHFEVCYYLLSTEDTPGSIANQTQAGSGREGLCELSKKLTDEFESKFKGRE